jgi:hypothetical protein
MTLCVRRIAVGVALMLPLAACGSIRRSDTLTDPVVIFHNESLSQADVYVVGSGGEPVRIGTVFAGRHESLRVPYNAIGAAPTINIMARMFASSRVVRTGSFAIGRGERVEVTLPSNEATLTVLPVRRSEPPDDAGP